MGFAKIDADFFLNIVDCFSEEEERQFLVI